MGELWKRILNTITDPTPILSQEEITRRYKNVLGKLGRKEKEPFSKTYFHDEKSHEIYVYIDEKWFGLSQKRMTIQEVLIIVEELKRDFGELDCCSMLFGEEEYVCFNKEEYDTKFKRWFGVF